MELLLLPTVTRLVARPTFVLIDKMSIMQQFISVNRIQTQNQYLQNQLLTIA